MHRHLRNFPGLRAAVPVLAVAAAGLMLAAAADARPPYGGPGGRGGERFLERHADQLGLDPAQRQAISDLVSSSEKQSEPLLEKLQSLHATLHQMLEADAPKAEVMSQVDAIGAAETQLHKLRLSTMMDIRSKLTKEQRKKLKDLRGELRGFAGPGLDQACAGDVKKLCPDATDPLARAQCLRQHHGNVSEDCSAALQCMKYMHGRHHWGRGGRGMGRPGMGGPGMGGPGMSGPGGPPGGGPGGPGAPGGPPPPDDPTYDE